MNNSPFVSVVMPTHNRSAFLDEALTALLDQSYPQDRYEVIVVDDGSTDATAPILERWQSEYPSRVRFIRHASSRGPSAARNRGIVESKGTVIAFIDDDCVATPDWLERIWEGYGPSDTVGVGGRVFPWVTDTAIQRYYSRYSVIAEPAMQRGEATYLVTANASFLRQGLLEVGGFSEQLTSPGGEDPELCMRLKNAGYQMLYAPNAVVYHRYSASLSALLRTFRNYGEGTAFLALRHTGGLLCHFAKAAGMIILPYRCLKHIRQGVRGADLLAFTMLDGLRGLAFIVGLCRGCQTHR